MVFFSGRIADEVFHYYPVGSYFNKKYADRLNGFSEDDLGLADRVFAKLLKDRQEHRPSQLSSQEGSILDRAVATLGDLAIGDSYGSHKLETFRRR
jgi:hypothetical protein